MLINPHDAAEAYGDYLDSLIPAGYAKREMYASFPPPAHATVRPPTGVHLLDLAGPACSSDVTAGMSKAALQAMGEHEAQVGLTHDVAYGRKKNKTKC